MSLAAFSFFPIDRNLRHSIKRGRVREIRLEVGVKQSSSDFFWSCFWLEKRGSVSGGVEERKEFDRKDRAERAGFRFGRGDAAVSIWRRRKSSCCVRFSVEEEGSCVKWLEGEELLVDFSFGGGVEERSCFLLRRGDSRFPVLGLEKRSCSSKWRGRREENNSWKKKEWLWLRLGERRNQGNREKLAAAGTGNVASKAEAQEVATARVRLSRGSLRLQRVE